VLINTYAAGLRSGSIYRRPMRVLSGVRHVAHIAPLLPFFNAT
jgi:hypothetical protein